MRTFAPAALGCLLAAALEAAAGPRLDLFERFHDPAAWAQGPETFLGETQEYGFRFLDLSGRSALASSDRDRLAFLGLPVYEARVYFDAAGARRLEASLYNRGDATNSLSPEAFDAAVADIRRRLNERLGPTGTDGTPDAARGNVIVRRREWTRQTPAAQLEWAYVRPHRTGERSVPYRADYISVRLVPLSGSVARDRVALTGSGILAKTKRSSDLLADVAREPNGDVWISRVPMVDQGQKGYCAAAASERVLRYYGQEIDEHRVAQLADTSARGGTSLRAMADAIEQIGRAHKLVTRELIKIEDGRDFLRSDLFRQLGLYNAAARRARKPAIDWKDYVEERRLDTGKLWEDIDPSVLLASRAAQTRELAAFRRAICQSIDAGVPLFWSCLLGLYPEDPPSGSAKGAGHIRLIIGYNARTGEILYSDSWGAAHAKKRMSVQTAWAMTQGLLVLKPNL